SSNSIPGVSSTTSTESASTPATTTSTTASESSITSTMTESSSTITSTTTSQGCTETNFVENPSFENAADMSWMFIPSNRISYQHSGPPMIAKDGDYYLYVPVSFPFSSFVARLT